MVYNEFLLPSELKGKGINSPKIIPTVCNLKNMFGKLKSLNGDSGQLKPWELRSYNNYFMDKLLPNILEVSDTEAIDIIRDHLIKYTFDELGASPFDIYIVAYVAQNIGVGKNTFIEYCINQGMAGTENSANAIYQVGKGDGIYLGILNNDGTVKDWEFMSRWLGY